jgi:hypothetical protein
MKFRNAKCTNVSRKFFLVNCVLSISISNFSNVLFACVVFFFYLRFSFSVRFSVLDRAGYCNGSTVELT